MHEVDVHKFHVFTSPKRWAVRHFRVRGLDTPSRHFFIVHHGEHLHDAGHTHAFQGVYSSGTLADKISEVYDEAFAREVAEKLYELMDG